MYSGGLMRDGVWMGVAGGGVGDGVKFMIHQIHLFEVSFRFHFF